MEFLRRSRRGLVGSAALVALAGGLTLAGPTAAHADNAHYFSLGAPFGAFTDPPSSDFVGDVAGNGRLVVFERSPRGDLLVNWQVNPANSTAYNGWVSLGGGITGSVGVVRESKLVDIFARGTDGQLWFNQEAGVGVLAWKGWQPLGGGIVGSPTAVRVTDGTAQVFVAGTDGGLWTIKQQTPGTGLFGSWTRIGNTSAPYNGIPSSVRPAAAVNTDGRVEVYAMTTSGEMDRWVQGTAFGTFNLATLSAVGAASGSPVAARNQAGTIEVFFPGSGNFLQYWSQASPGSLALRISQLTNAPSNGEPAVTFQLNGAISVFTRNPATFEMLNAVETGNSSGAYGPFTNLNGAAVIARPDADSNFDGRDEVFVLRGDGAIWHTWQTSPNGPWI